MAFLRMENYCETLPSFREGLPLTTKKEGINESDKGNQSNSNLPQTNETEKQSKSEDERFKLPARVDYPLAISFCSEFFKFVKDFMPNIKELYPLHGSFVNLEYPLPNGKKVKFLDDSLAYLGNQVECEFDEENKKYFGILADMNFLLVCKYGENGSDPEIIVYSKR